MMRSIKLLLAALLVAAMILSASVAAAAEDEEYEYEYVCDDGTEMHFYSEIELTETEISRLAYGAWEDVEMYCELLDEGEYCVDEEPSGPSTMAVQSQDDPHHEHTFVINATVAATKHYVFDEAPKCLECRFKVFTCTVCGSKGLGFTSSRRVACHSGTVVKDWEIYDNYLYYNNRDGHKQDGYVTDHVTVKMKPLVTGNPDRSAFPGISQYITGFEYNENGRYAVIYFSAGGSSRPDYSAGDIDKYVSCLKYLDALPYSDGVFPAVKHDESVPETQNDAQESPAPSDDKPDADTPSSPAGDTPSQGNQPYSEPEPFVPVREDRYDAGSHDVTITNAPGVPAQNAGGNETPAAPLRAAANDVPSGSGLYNPPTGDGLPILISAAVCSASLIVLSVMICYHNRKKGYK